MAENEIDGYISKVGEVTNGTITVTNTEITETTTEATVKKVWDDSDNKDKKRPSELEVTLSDGTKVTLNEENNWTATVKDLPKYDGNNEIIYTWTEGSVPEGYKLEKTETEGTVTTLTNKYTPEEKIVTGDRNRTLPYIICLSFSAVIMVIVGILFVRRKREDQR